MRWHTDGGPTSGDVRMIVNTTHGPSANAEQVGGHADTINHYIYFRARLVRPVDGLLDDLHSTAISNGQQFHIKAETVHPHSAEELLCRDGGEELESALRVRELRDGEAT